MKRIGTITSSIGFIFIGLVLGIKTINPSLASTLSKLWFLIFIILGVEVIILSKKYDNPKFSKLSIFVIILMIILRGYFFVINMVGDNLNNLHNVVNDIGSKNLNVYDSGISFNDEILLDSVGNKIKIESFNGNIEVIRSQDNKIKLQSNIILKKGIEKNKYKLNYEKSSEGYEFKFDDNIIRKADIIIYIPDKYLMELDLINGDIKCESEDLKADYDIDLVNGYINLIGDINKAKISSSNSNIDIRNKEFKELKINNINGDVNINTNTKNLDLSLKSVTGKCNFKNENEKSINKKLGNGESKVQVEACNGDVYMVDDK